MQIIASNKDYNSHPMLPIAPSREFPVGAQVCSVCTNGVSGQVRNQECHAVSPFIFFLTVQTPRRCDVTRIWRQRSAHLSFTWLPWLRDYILPLGMCVSDGLYLDAGQPTEFYVRDFDTQTLKALQLIRVIQLRAGVYTKTTNSVMNKQWWFRVK